MTRLRLCFFFFFFFLPIYHRNDVCPSQCIISRSVWCRDGLLLMIFTLITLEVVSARFLYSKLLFFPCNWWISWGEMFKTMLLYIFSSNFCPVILASIGGSCLQQLLLWCLPNGNFVSLIPSNLLIGIPPCGRAVPSPPLCIYSIHVWTHGYLF